jgi:hypothetical protein
MGQVYPQPIYVFLLRAILPVSSYFAKAIAAVYRSVFARLKWDFSFFTAFGAYHWVHLPGRPVAIAAVSVSFQLSGLPTLGTTLGLIGIAF